MAIFQSNTCAAFTWDSDNNFRGVLIERTGDTFVVRNHWQGTNVGSRSHAQVLETATADLGISEDTTVIIGGDFGKACFVDIQMPKMSPPDLRSALNFELNKHTPVPIDEIRWGYRILGKVEGTERNLIRVVYFLREEWESWVGGASGITGGVDLIIPTIAVLDPQMTGVDVCLNANNGHGTFMFTSGDSGCREIAFIDPKTDTYEVIGYGADPLRMDKLELRQLGDLPDDQQATFAPAIILGMYGVSDGFYHDRKDWLPVPVEMRPRRNRGHKIFTTAVVVYLFFLIGILASAFFYDKYTEYQELDAQLRRLQYSIDRLQVLDVDDTFSDGLEAEIAEQNQAVLSMPAALVELTGLLSDELWSSNFNWDSGEIRAELRSEIEDTNLSLTLEESPLFTDLTMRKRQVGEQFIYTINCRMKGEDQLDDLYNSSSNRSESRRQPQGNAPYNRKR